MQPNEIIEVLNRPISQELLARDVTRSHIGMSTTKNAPNSRGHPRAQAPETTAPVGETHLSVWLAAHEAGSLHQASWNRSSRLAW
uniref:Uncharacterized protein n=1 Tax=Streptomyces avermitilis TaxID=33903 RepID=A0A499VGC9_STRAX|nr:hypothetical protein SAVMC3_06180 [Streptomyces avermitilis]